jgi:AcrR family transcriptional regulator
LNVKDKVVKAAEKLVQTMPFDRITFAEIAKEAGVHWTAVRRHLGSKQEMRAWLKQKQSAQPGHFADTRTRIMEAGMRMFAELGYNNASLDKVATDAGLTKGAVYWHFSSKQDLFLAILEHQLNEQLRMLPRQIDHMLNASDPEAALADWLSAQFCFIEEEDGKSMLFLEFVTSSREPEVRARLQAIHGKILDGAAMYIKEMQKKEMIRTDLDPQAISMMADSLLKGLVVEWLIDPERVKLNQLFQTISKILWHGMRPQQ